MVWGTEEEASADNLSKVPLSKQNPGDNCTYILPTSKWQKLLYAHRSYEDLSGFVFFLSALFFASAAAHFCASDSLVVFFAASFLRIASKAASLASGETSSSSSTGASFSSVGFSAFLAAPLGFASASFSSPASAAFFLSFFF